MKFVLCFVFLVLAALGCGEEESSTCEVGGPCEAFLLTQCECCANGDLVEGGSQDLVDQCKQELTNACGTGQFMLNQSPETCQSNLDAVMQYQAAGMDFCAEVDSDQLGQLCTLSASDSSSDVAE